MDVYDAIHTRRSVRQFTDADVTDAQVERVLRAAMAAPSAGNGQPWRFVVVRDAETLAKLAASTPYAGPIGRAPVGIVVLAEVTAEKFAGLWPLDCSAATENLMLAAHARGLGTCWLGVYPEAEREAAVAEIVGVPDNMRVMCMVAVGVPDGHAPVVDRYRPELVRNERWTQ